MVELTPAVQDAAYRLGWAMAGAGVEWAELPLFYPGPAGEPIADIDKALFAGFNAFTPAAEAERVEAVREWHESERTMMAELGDCTCTADYSDAWEMNPGCTVHNPPNSRLHTPDEFDVEDAYAARRVNLSDTQGCIPDASMVMQWKDEAAPFPDESFEQWIQGAND